MKEAHSDECRAGLSRCALRGVQPSYVSSCYEYKGTDYADDQKGKE